jgi:DNA polymerase-3 subunit gamma/tau
MIYKALYRKYRPTSFKDVCGQESIVKTLQNSIKEEKICHAYLFTGTRGTGKTTIAKIFAKTVNCLALENGNPCGKCDICIKEGTDEIQDIIEIDAASNNGVDEIREIKNKVNLVPTICKYKIYIIDEVHMLSIGAFNALLKTLEEPPAHVIFILATTEPQKLPTTIISRCQRFDFKKIPIDNVVNHLKKIAEKEKININEECLKQIAILGDGSMRDSIGLLEQAHSYSDGKVTEEDIYQISGSISEQKVMEILNIMVEKDIEKLLDVFDDLYNEGKDFEKITENLIIFLRNSLICKNAPKYFEKKNMYSKDLIFNFSKRVDEKDLIYLIKETNFLLTDIKRSSHPNIIFELFLFKMSSKEENSENKENRDIPAKLEIKQVETKSKEQPVIKINVVESEFTNELKIDFSDIKKEAISEYKKVLINNTIALADKEDLNFMQENWKKIQTYLVKKKYKDAATILLDSKINAVSKDHVLLTYKYESMVENHDKEKRTIENLIFEITEKKYKVVAISETCWNELRPYYVELKKGKKNIDLMEEIEPDESTISNKKKASDPVVDNAIDAFGEDLIEMEG